MHTNLKVKPAFGQVRRCWRLAALASLPLAGCDWGSGQDLAERHQLRASAYAWENRMPGALLPGSMPECVPLYVMFTIAGNELPLPSDIKAPTVALRKNGTIHWTTATSPTETGLASDNTFVGAARGCRTEAFTEGDVLDVLVRVQSGAESVDVVTKVVLTTAY